MAGKSIKTAKKQKVVARPKTIAKLKAVEKSKMAEKPKVTERLKMAEKQKRLQHREITFVCRRCAQHKPIKEMVTVTRFIPALVVCQDCARELR